MIVCLVARDLRWSFWNDIIMLISWQMNMELYFNFHFWWSNNSIVLLRIHCVALCSPELRLFLIILFSFISNDLKSFMMHLWFLIQVRAFEVSIYGHLFDLDQRHYNIHYLENVQHLKIRNSCNSIFCVH